MLTRHTWTKVHAGAGALSPLLTDLISYWKMDEAAGAQRDDSTGTNHLTDNNNCGQVAGVISNAVEFDDAFNQYLSHVDNDSLGVAGNQDFTFAFWFNQRTAFALDYFISKWQGGGSNNDEYYIRWNNRNFQFAVRGTDNTTQTVTWGALLNIPPQWYFAVCWRDGVNIYVDIDNSGVPASAAWAKQQKNSTQDYYMGRLGGTYSDTYIDECGFWKRVLTAAERTELWNGGAGLTYPF